MDKPFEPIYTCNWINIPYFFVPALSPYDISVSGDTATTVTRNDDTATTRAMTNMK